MTAVEARLKTESSQKSLAFEYIEDAIKNGNYSVKIFPILEEDVVDYLKSLGYKVEEYRWDQTKNHNFRACMEAEHTLIRW